MRARGACSEKHFRSTIRSYLCKTPMNDAVDEKEVERFGAIAGEWWNPRGKFAPLHRINPPRLGFIRERLLIHTGRTGREPKPFSGLDVLDIGCGGGLISEPLCRLGANVTGLDPSMETIGAARTHASSQSLSIDYRCGTAEELAASGAVFDVITALEVIEHVPDVPAFLGVCGRLTKPSGLIVLSTLNRTAKSYALGIVAAEYLLGWLPKGTHDWRRFVEPAELRAALAGAGFQDFVERGLSYHAPSGDWRLSEDLSINYAMSASRAR
jgi:2-polyprenyl-6-hydroxyphenyl methylase/3-demethylubiquinone-9 3-methyltransferase